ncbi:MAG: iron-containing alcohol dehydrogenase [Desulfofustis sp.]|jgi:alcohol dehydrogenase YqhD (iron-dependent ADH family)
MESFVYHHPVKIIFGPRALDQLGRELSSLGSRVLFVYGQRSIKETGLHDRIIKILHQSGVAYTEFGGVRPNPRLSSVRRGIMAVRDTHCDAILAVGGGSVVDAAKAIGAGSLAEHDVWRFFTGKKSVGKTLPLLSVPTVAGSGSEVNHGMVLTHDEQSLKFGFAHRYLFPRVCIADPSLTCSVSAQQTAYGCVDALCHCLEPYLTTRAPAIDFQQRFLENCATTLIEATRSCLAEPFSYSHRAAMLWSSMMALAPLSTAGLGRIHHSLHVLEHGVSALHNIPHGAGLAALLSGWLSSHLEEFRNPLARWGEKVFGVAGTTDKDKSQATIEALHNLLLLLGCPTRLSDLGLAEGDLDPICAHAAAQLRVRGIPGLDERKSLAILKRAL